MADLPPILAAKHHDAVSVFQPANLLREARRQRGLAELPVPEICLLDPDGDIVRALRADGRGRLSRGWACYHTEMLEFSLAGQVVGAVGCAVGGPFAVLIAEQMFASGCRLLISVTSAGRIADDLPAAGFFMVIERALRDEGTSHHYRPAEEPFAAAPAGVTDRAAHRLGMAGLPCLRGASWTTDAPYRETAEAIVAAAAQGVLAVEMEAASLYAFAAARGVPVLCLAHVTNAMARSEGDFEKGEADGSAAALAILAALINDGPDGLACEAAAADQTAVGTEELPCISR